MSMYEYVCIRGMYEYVSGYVRVIVEAMFTYLAVVAVVRVLVINCFLSDTICKSRHMCSIAGPMVLYLKLVVRTNMCHYLYAQYTNVHVYNNQ